MRPNLVVIGVGSNINPEENIGLAEQAISSEHELLKTSSFIKTEPIGFKDQEEFTNGAYLIRTHMEQEELNVWLKNLEDKLDRIRTENKFGPRTIDLDILVWNSIVVDSDVQSRPFLRDSIQELLPEMELKD